MDGLNENQSISKIQMILKEIGIEGKPSLEQCKVIKKRREFEAELKEIDTSNIIEGKRRVHSNFSNKSSPKKMNTEKKRTLIVSDSSDSNESSDTESDGVVIDLKAFGDSESD